MNLKRAIEGLSAITGHVGKLLVEKITHLRFPHLLLDAVPENNSVGIRFSASPRLPNIENRRSFIW